MIDILKVKEVFTMATVIKHKQRSRRVWQTNSSTRRSAFNIFESNAGGIIQAKLMRKAV